MNSTLLPISAAVASSTTPALITNDAVVLGLLMGTLALIFWSSQNPSFKRFYTYVPALLLCYFIPGLFGTLGLISGEHSQLYFVASRYLLPTSLVLLTLSLDLRAIRRLGSKIVIMFLAGTFGVLIGGPLAILIVSTVSPETVGGVVPDTPNLICDVEVVCNQLEDAYLEAVTGASACREDSDCQILNGQCGSGVGGCYEFVNMTLTQEDLDAIGRRFGAQCNGPVCDCPPPPNNIACNDGICGPGN